jgi:hypothetical protein
VSVEYVGQFRSVCDSCGRPATQARVTGDRVQGWCGNDCGPVLDNVGVRVWPHPLLDGWCIDVTEEAWLTWWGKEAPVPCGLGLRAWAVYRWADECRGRPEGPIDGEPELGCGGDADFIWAVDFDRAFCRDCSGRVLESHTSTAWMKGGASHEWTNGRWLYLTPNNGSDWADGLRSEMLPMPDHRPGEIPAPPARRPGRPPAFGFGRR